MDIEISANIWEPLSYCGKVHFILRKMYHHRANNYIIEVNGLNYNVSPQARRAYDFLVALREVYSYYEYAISIPMLVASNMALLYARGVIRKANGLTQDRYVPNCTEAVYEAMSNITTNNMEDTIIDALINYDTEAFDGNMWIKVAEIFRVVDDDIMSIDDELEIPHKPRPEYIAPMFHQHN